MLKSVEGIYRQGKVELAEPPTGVKDNTRVIVTFLDSSGINLEAHGINQSKAAELRSRLAAFEHEGDTFMRALYAQKR